MLLPGEVTATAWLPTCDVSQKVSGEAARHRKEERDSKVEIRVTTKWKRDDGR